MGVGRSRLFAMMPRVPPTSILFPQPFPDLRRAPRLVDLLTAGDRQRIRRNIAGNDTAGGDDRAVTDFDRRDQRGVRADKRALADYCAEFVKAVVIAGDRAGADIGACADLAVADIGEVTRLDARAEAGCLDLDEIADMHPLLEDRPGPQ